MLHSTLQELNNFYPVLTCTQFMAAQIHNFQILSHLFYFSFQSLCGALGDALRSTWTCSAEHLDMLCGALGHALRSTWRCSAEHLEMLCGALEHALRSTWRCSAELSLL